MKIKSVTVNTVVEINGKQIVINTADFAETIKEAKKDGIKLDTEKDILEWLESDYSID